MESVRVIMLGRFDILAGGKSTLSYFGHSQKGTLLLQYLLLNRDKDLTTANFVDALWPEPDQSNPEGALKTMVSRLRANLAEASPALKNCILSKNKSYKWNPNIPCTIDVEEFEQLCEEAGDGWSLTTDTRERYTKILDLYRGDISGPLAQDWLTSRSMYLHHRYLASVYRFIELLKINQEHETIQYVCRTALKVDPYDETLNVELIKTLEAQGHRGAAFRQYRFITDAYSKYLGIEPSDTVKNLQEPLIRTANLEEGDIDSVREELREPDDRTGAFVCDYAVFRDIYQFQRHNRERQQARMFLALITVETTKGAQPKDTNDVMEDLLQVLMNCLRRGDTIARYSQNQFALLLPMTSIANGEEIIARIRRRFYGLYPQDRFHVSLQLGPATTR